MKFLKIAFQILIAVQVLGIQTRADEVGGVYVKNTGKDLMHLWVNGYYQGYVRPGETRYTVSDGFITEGSDRPTDSGGRTPVAESHGGWDNTKSGSIELTFQYPGDKRQSSKFDVNGRKDLAVGVNESTATSSPQPPDEIEIERAPAIIKGNLSHLQDKISENPGGGAAENIATWRMSDDTITLFNGNVAKSLVYGNGRWEGNVRNSGDKTLAGETSRLEVIFEGSYGKRIFRFRDKRDVDDGFDVDVYGNDPNSSFAINSSRAAYLLIPSE